MKEQQWIYDVPEKALQSRGGIGGVLFEGFNKNLITFRNMHMKNQKFLYDWKKKTWSNIATKNMVDINGDVFKAAQNVVTEPADGTKGQKWDIYYCDNNGD